MWSLQKERFDILFIAYHLCSDWIQFMSTSAFFQLSLSVADVSVIWIKENDFVEYQNSFTQISDQNFLKYAKKCINAHLHFIQTYWYRRTWNNHPHTAKTFSFPIRAPCDLTEDFNNNVLYMIFPDSKRFFHKHADTKPRYPTAQLEFTLSELELSTS